MPVAKPRQAVITVPVPESPIEPVVLPRTSAPTMELFVAVAATVNHLGVQVFAVCARHIRPRWADEAWRLVPLADLIGGERS